MEDSIPKTWEEKLKIIEEINILDLEKTSIDEISNIYYGIFKGLALLNIDFPRDLNLFRAINHEIKPTTWEKIIYPPVSKAKINRASDAGEQMFYCATIKKTPFYELDIQIGQRLVITNWINAERLLLQIIGYSTEELTKLIQIYGSTIKINANQIAETENNIKSIEYLKQAFSSKVQNELEYKRTIAIARHFFGGYSKIDQKFPNFVGLLYHTIRLESEADNIVLKPAAIDKGIIEFRQIEYIEILDKKDNKYFYRLIDYADTIENQIIQWRNLERSWILNDESDDIYFLDNEMYTAFGDIIPPSS